MLSSISIQSKSLRGLSISARTWKFNFKAKKSCPCGIMISMKIRPNGAFKIKEKIGTSPMNESIPRILLFVYYFVFSRILLTMQKSHCLRFKKIWLVLIFCHVRMNFKRYHFEFYVPQRLRKPTLFIYGNFKSFSSDNQRNFRIDVIYGGWVVWSDNTLSVTTWIWTYYALIYDSNVLFSCPAKNWNVRRILLSDGHLVRPQKKLYSGLVHKSMSKLYISWVQVIILCVLY